MGQLNFKIYKGRNIIRRMSFISLDNLLEEIAAEPLNNYQSKSSKEKRFLNELESLHHQDLELYLKYFTKYLRIRNDKIREGL